MELKRYISLFEDIGEGVLFVEYQDRRNPRKVLRIGSMYINIYLGKTPLFSVGELVMSCEQMEQLKYHLNIILKMIKMKEEVGYYSEVRTLTDNSIFINKEIGLDEIVTIKVTLKGEKEESRWDFQFKSIDLNDVILTLDGLLETGELKDIIL